MLTLKKCKCITILFVSFFILRETKKKSEDARTETEDKLFRYAFGPHLIQLDPIHSMQFLKFESKI